MTFELVSLKSAYNIYEGKVDVSESHYYAPLRKLKFVTVLEQKSKMAEMCTL